MSESMTMSTKSEAFEVGDELEPLVLGEITRAQIAEYSRVSADPNLLHTDEEVARVAGFPSVFAQGTLSMAFLARHAVGVCGVGKLRRIKTRFETLTWPGERIICRARVVEIRDVDDERLVTCNVHTENQDGETKVVGSVTFAA